MDWTIQDWGALGELIASVGVVVTLVYVGVQLRQNTVAMRSATTLAVSQSTAEVFKNNCQDFERTQKFFELATKDNLTASERFFYLGFAMQPYRVQENAYHQRKLGVIDPSFLNIEERVRATISNPVFRRAWDENLAQPFLSMEYVDFVGKVLSDPKYDYADFGGR